MRLLAFLVAGLALSMPSASDNDPFAFFDPSAVITAADRATLEPEGRVQDDGPAILREVAKRLSSGDPAAPSASSDTGARNEGEVR
jgi:hypothetical protein